MPKKLNPMAKPKKPVAAPAKKPVTVIVKKPKINKSIA